MNDPFLTDTTKAPSLDDLTHDEGVEAMKEWFWENFEDPANETPYESREGGYQWIWGGPFDARDEITDAFPDADEDDIEAAVERVQHIGFDFAPAGHRIRNPEPDDEREPHPPLGERLAALSGQLDRIEETVRGVARGARHRPHRWHRT